MAKKSKAEKKAEKAAEQARLEAERLEAERVEAERLEAERIERERQERIRKELERVRKTKEAETLAETYHSALPPAGVLVEIHRIYNGDSFSLAARQQAQSNRESISILPSLHRTGPAPPAWRARASRVFSGSFCAPRG